MPSMNKVMLIGRLTRDPEMRYTQAGLAVASFSIAVDRVAKNQDGSKKTDFFRCNAWRQKAEFVNQYVGKGRLVAIDGRIELNEYIDKDGAKRFSTDIVCDNVELLDSNKEQQAPAGEPQPYPASAPATAAPPAAQRPPSTRPAPPPVAGRPAPPKSGNGGRPAPAPTVDPYGDDDDFDGSDPFADE